MNLHDSNRVKTLDMYSLDAYLIVDTLITYQTNHKSVEYESKHTKEMLLTYR
jgi:hypothetical protein